MALGHRIYCASCGELFPFERVVSQRLEDGAMKSLVDEVGLLCAGCRVSAGGREPEPFELSKEALKQRREKKGIQLPGRAAPEERQPAGDGSHADSRGAFRKSYRRPW